MNIWMHREIALSIPTFARTSRTRGIQVLNSLVHHGCFTALENLFHLPHTDDKSKEVTWPKVSNDPCELPSAHGNYSTICASKFNSKYNPFTTTLFLWNKAEPLN